MSSRHFACTACGLCCYGLVPLTIDEAVQHAARFPLAITITPIKPGTRGHNIVEHIGATVTLPSKKRSWLLITPVAFIPPTVQCPELSADNLCGIHDQKPVRCRAMPFYAYKDEDHQTEVLTPRANWECDTTENAPLVYRDRKIVERDAFDCERQALLDQAEAIRRYSELLLKHSPAILAQIEHAARLPSPGRVVVSFVSIIRYDKRHDLVGFARQQLPVLEKWQTLTNNAPKATEFNNFYRQAGIELGRYVRTI